MATTDFPLNHPQARKYWSPDLFKQALMRTYAFRFMSSGKNSIVQVDNTLQGDGDRVRFNLRIQLSGRGVTGDSTLEGNEEALTIYHDDLYINQLRHAVRVGGKMSRQRVPYKLREEARDGLADWWADRYDYWFFNHLTGNTAQTDLAYVGHNATIAPTLVVEPPGTTSTASLSTTDTFSIQLIDYAVEQARMHTYPIRPVNVGGKQYFVLFIHEYQLTDLRREFNTLGDGWGDIQKAAIQGGQTTGNPIFTGAAGLYNNTIIHATNRLPEPITNVRRAVFCGAQSLGMAFGRGYGLGSKFSWVENSIDYENDLGVGAGVIAGIKKLQFNGEDLSTIVIPTYAAAHSG